MLIADAFAPEDLQGELPFSGQADPVCDVGVLAAEQAVGLAPAPLTPPMALHRLAADDPRLT